MENEGEEVGGSPRAVFAHSRCRCRSVCGRNRPRAEQLRHSSLLAPELKGSAYLPSRWGRSLERGQLKGHWAVGRRGEVLRNSSGELSRAGVRQAC